MRVVPWPGPKRTVGGEILVLSGRSLLRATETICIWFPNGHPAQYCLISSVVGEARQRVSGGFAVGSV
jgi:hypothetical protein